MSDFFFYTDHMSVGYNGKPLIEEVKIELNRGQILTLIGPNGAGKSTILKSITRQLRLIAGKVYISDQNMARMSGNDIAKKMAVVLTERINPEMMTCRDVVNTGRYPYTGTLGLLSEEDKQKANRALALVHAEDIADQEFSAISDGQRQRILLARAICQEPELIVLDEPTSFLDIRHKLEFLSILKKMVREQNVAVIMSLHELDLAQKVSDIVMCVNSRTIEKYGAPEEIFKSDYIRSLYGVTTGTYNDKFGCMELDKNKGPVKTFVIGGGGTAVPVYRKLQRLGIPFAAGILNDNDIDYEAAKTIATEVIHERAFYPPTEETVCEAQRAIDKCDTVICTIREFGPFNEANKSLLEYAVRIGKAVEYEY